MYMYMFYIQFLLYSHFIHYSIVSSLFTDCEFRYNVTCGWFSSLVYRCSMLAAVVGCQVFQWSRCVGAPYCRQHSQHPHQPFHCFPCYIRNLMLKLTRVTIVLQMLQTRNSNVLILLRRMPSIVISILSYVIKSCSKSISLVQYYIIVVQYYIKNIKK